MHPEQEVVAHGHLQIIGESGNRRWRAFWWDADGKHTRVLGPAWAKNSGKRTARGAIVWHVADGPKPDPSYITPREAQAQLRRLLEHEAVTVATPPAPKGAPMTFADAAEAWLLHGERKRALKRSTLADYRQALDAYLPPDRTRPDTAHGRAPFATMPLRDIRSAQLKDWYERLPYGRTSEKLLMIVRRSSGMRGRAAGSTATRAAPSSANRSATRVTTTCTHSRRSTRWCGRRPMSRTQRSS